MKLSVDGSKLLDTKYDKAKSKIYVNKNNLGKAGEFLTAGKLLLNGFNVYTSAVDDGIDLIAKKSKKFYYIQVKTAQDLDLDAGKFMAQINLDTLTKHPSNRTFVVLVLHYLRPTASIDFMGDHNYYEQQFIVMPIQALTEFFGKTSGKIVCFIYSSIIGDYPDKINWLVKLKHGKNELILDHFLIDSFWQIEI